MARNRIEFLRARVEATPEDTRARLFLASELYRQEAWAEAAGHFEAYLVTRPQDPASARMHLGLCLERLGCGDDAAAHYRRAIEEAVACGHAGLAEEIRTLLPNGDA